YDNSTFTFLRKGKDESVVLVAINATPVPRPNYRAGVPTSGFWKEILNTDSKVYSGSNTGNQGGVETSAEGWNGRPYSIEVNLPPLGVVMFAPQG
ncbi:MAG: alpha amylase C-terminal domain-containing protein, partial [Verrucomicrobiota bacterium]